MARIEPPWSAAQVDALNKWQRLGYVHEFICPNDHEGDKTLFARRIGWECPHCVYRQDWAHDYMGDEAQHPEDPRKDHHQSTLARGDEIEEDFYRLKSQETTAPAREIKEIVEAVMRGIARVHGVKL